MKIPENLEELAAMVNILNNNNNNITVIESINAERLPKMFYTKLPDEQMKLLFVFMVLAVSLKSKDKKKQKKALFELQNRVFSNARTRIANISFTDTDRVVKKIFE